MKLNRTAPETPYVPTTEDKTRAAATAAVIAEVNSDPLALGGMLPASLGRCADLYHDVRELRLAMDKEVEAVKARETEIQEHIIANLSRSEDTGAAGLRYRAQVRTEAKPQIADWATLTAFVAKSGRFDLLQKRLGDKAVSDMWADNKDVPGVAKVNVPKLSVTKI